MASFEVIKVMLFNWKKNEWDLPSLIIALTHPCTLQDPNFRADNTAEIIGWWWSWWFFIISGEAEGDQEQEQRKEADDSSSLLVDLKFVKCKIVARAGSGVTEVIGQLVVDEEDIIIIIRAAINYTYSWRRRRETRALRICHLIASWLIAHFAGVPHWGREVGRVGAGRG